MFEFLKKLIRKIKKEDNQVIHPQHDPAQLSSWDW